MIQSEPSWFVRRVLSPCLKILGVPRNTATSGREGPSVALLIDGENCSPELAAAALAEAAKFGVVRVRRVYANWASANHRGWMDVVARHHLEPIHHARTATGKNATDIALVVDAMDLLHSGEITCFCLVASDSDYTPLVQRLRAANRIVIGLGRANTTTALTQACSVFLTLNAPAASSPSTITRAAASPGAVPAAQVAQPHPVATNGQHLAPPTPVAQDAPGDPAPLLVTAWKTVARARGEVSLSNLVLELQRSAPTLSPQSYGYTKLAQLIKQRTDLFTIQVDATEQSRQIVRRVGRKSVPDCEPIETLLRAAWERAPRQDGWLFTGILGQYLKLVDPSFDPRHYGHSRLGLLLQAHPELCELRQRSKGQYDVRLRQVIAKG
jgi:hypothetical protein